MMIAHNHPSGNLTPSQADKYVTEKLEQAGKLMDIKLTDHLIISPAGKYFSFAEHGYL
jgi:DNA repair protein RadC